MKQHETNLAIIGKYIKKQRKLKKLSQEEVANLAELSFSYYGRVERGEQNISIKNLVRIAQALNVPFGDLLPPLETLKKE